MTIKKAYIKNFCSNFLSLDFFLGFAPFPWVSGSLDVKFCSRDLLPFFHLEAQREFLNDKLLLSGDFKLH